jgi:hypothetical protein
MRWPLRHAVMRCFGMSGPTMLPRGRLGLPRSREASEFSDRLGGGGREHGRPFLPIGRCRWRGIVHTKPEAPVRRAARKLFGRPKSSKIDAHTCPEGGDANKPGPTCYATELLGSRDKESAAYRSTEVCTDADPPTRQDRPSALVDRPGIWGTRRQAAGTRRLPPKAQYFRRSRVVCPPNEGRSRAETVGRSR